MVETTLSPARVRDVTADKISYWQASLRKGGLSEQTIASYSRHLKAALRWAADIGLIAKAPKITMPKRAKGTKLAKSRPIYEEEHERMMLKVEAVVGEHAAPSWKELLEGLWHSGLRITESLNLSWDEDAGFAIDLSGKHPKFRIAADSQKSGCDELTPMSPSFAEMLLKVPPNNRKGRVFRPLHPHTGKYASRDAVIRTVTAIGRKAGVIVARTGKMQGVTEVIDGKKREVEREVLRYASAHSYRRAFGTRCARRVMPAVLQRMMRHSAIQTTLAFYVDLDVDSLGDELWRQHEERKGTVLGTGGENVDVESVDVSNLTSSGEAT